MKKIIVLILVFFLCLSLSACGKSEAVKNVEAMIDALGEITIESIDAIRAAEDAYEVLMPEEQKKVKNYETLTSARDRYYEFVLVGNWYDTYIWIGDVKENYERTAYLVLNADMTGIEYGDGDIEDAITWSVKNRNLEFRFESGNMLSFPIIEEQGKILLNGFSNLLMEDDYFDYLNDIFLVVDLSEVDINDYLELYVYEEVETDDFGDPTGNIYGRVLIRSKLYSEGWYYLNRQNMAIEVLYPKFTSTDYNMDGTVQTRTIDAYAETMPDFDEPFTHDVGTVYHIDQNNGTKWVADISADQLTFGRAKGKLYFINEKYVTAVKPSDDQHFRELFTVFSEYPYQYGPWIEDIQY